MQPPPGGDEVVVRDRGRGHAEPFCMSTPRPTGGVCRNGQKDRPSGGYDVEKLAASDRAQGAVTAYRRGLMR